MFDFHRRIIIRCVFFRQKCIINIEIVVVSNVNIVVINIVIVVICTISLNLIITLLLIVLNKKINIVIIRVKNCE